MKTVCRNAAVLTLVLLPLTMRLAAQGNDRQLKTTLEKLDQASARFTSAEASVHKVFYNSVIRSDDDEQDGKIYFLRERAGTTQMGLATTGKGARTVEYKGGTVRVYNPGLSCYDSVTRPGIETYLTLGFGGSGKDLTKVWDINDLGPEKLDGITVEKLDLTPKDAAVKANVTKMTLWVDLARGVSLKQVLIAPSNDRQTALYTNIKLNAKVDTKAYAIKGKPCGK